MVTAMVVDTMLVMVVDVVGDNGLQQRAHQENVPFFYNIYIYIIKNINTSLLLCKIHSIV